RRLILQQFNRRQDAVSLLKASWEYRGPSSMESEIPPFFRDHDDAWIDLQDKLWWTDPNREFLWLSERDGWRHIYKVSLSSGTPTLITPGDYDVIKIEGIDKASRNVYFTASRDNATQKYLYSVGLDGRGLENLNREDQPGTHDYDVSPDGRW